MKKFLVLKYFTPLFHNFCTETFRIKLVFYKTFPLIYQKMTTVSKSIFCEVILQSSFSIQGKYWKFRNGISILSDFRSPFFILCPFLNQKNFFVFDFLRQSFGTTLGCNSQMTYLQLLQLIYTILVESRKELKKKRYVFRIRKLKYIKSVIPRINSQRINFNTESLWIVISFNE